MKLLEYQAKLIVEKYDIPSVKSTVVGYSDNIAEKIAAANLEYPVVIKAQVLIGGRGKAGGVRFAENEQEATALCSQMLGMEIRGHTARELMVAHKLPVHKEWYLSIMLDRFSKAPLLIFSPCGGIDIEEVAAQSPDKIAKVPIDVSRGIQNYTIEYAMDITGADKNYKPQLMDIAQKLLKLFYAYNTLLVEINPLVIDDNDNLVAIDRKIEIDDNALGSLPDIMAYREKSVEEEFVKEAREHGFHYVSVDDEGEIGVMSNGSGMMMSCIDLISKKGMKVGAALDLGGGATSERIKHAVRIMLANNRINSLFICVFGGITRCDEVAKGAVLAMELPEAKGKKLMMRLEGTNRQEAADIIAGSGLPIQQANGIPEAVELLFGKGE